MKFHRRTTSLFLAVAASAIHSGGLAATEITVVFDTSAENLPPYDPDGSKLELIANAAVAMWESLLPESGHNYSVAIHYGPFPTASTLFGLYNDFDHTITIRNNWTWFLDPTPLENEEFNPFQQVLAGSLTGVEADSFVGPVPALLETGYFAVAISGGAAEGVTDMFSAVLHEMGHFLVIGHNVFKPNVPLLPQFIGNVSGVQAVREDEGHLTPDAALMDPGIGNGRRVLPSALDLIAAAHEQNHSFIRLRRQDWLGDAASPLDKLWFNNTGWEGGSPPVAQTEVWIRNGDAVMVASAPAVARNLRIRNDSGVSILSESLHIHGELELDDPDYQDDSHVDVFTGAALNVGGLLYIRQGLLQMAGGVANLNALHLDRLTNVLPGVTGHGTVEINPGPMWNEGLLEGDGGTLQFTGGPAVTFDLDASSGTDRPRLRALTGNLEFHRPLSTSYGGQVEIAGGHWIGFVGSWEFGTSSDVLFKNGPGLADFKPLAAGTILYLRGDAAVEDNAQARFKADQIQLVASTDLSVGAGAELSLEGAITYASGDHFSGDGTLHQNGDAMVTGNVIIGIGTFDWDGNLAAPTNTTIVGPAWLTINAQGLAGAYAGRTDVGEEGHLVVNISGGLGTWILDEKGKIRLFKNSHLAGSWCIVAGTLEAMEGAADIDNITTLTAKSAVLLHDHTRMNMNVQTTYGGGVVTTDSGMLDHSRFQQFSTASVLGHQRITAGFFNWDADDTTSSDTTISQDGHLDIHAKQIGNGIAIPIFLSRSGFGDRIDINSGRLTVTVGFEGPSELYPDEWKLNEKGVMNLNHTAHPYPRVNGSRVINNGTISGEGEFHSPLENRGVLEIGHADTAGRILAWNTFQNTTDGVVRIELGGDGPGTLYDQLYVDGPAMLAGKLEVSLLADFVPAGGQSFRIIEGGASAAVGGTFSVLDLPYDPSFWNMTYDPNFVDLRFVGQVCHAPRADFDGDNDVDLNDFARLQACYTGGPAGFDPIFCHCMDLNSDNAVDASDFAIFRSCASRSAVPPPACGF